MDEQKNKMVLGAVSKVNSAYSTYFSKNFNVDGSPSDTELESIFNNPEDNMDDIVGYLKYCYRKYGVIMRVVNMIRDFGSTGLSLDYPSKNKEVKKVIEAYNNKIEINCLLRDMIYEIALTGNLVCYDRDGHNVDIYPINKIKAIPLIEDGKQRIAYKTEYFTLNDSFGKDIDDKVEQAYPKEILDNKNSQYIPLDKDKAFFKKINASRYEPYGMSIIVPAFEDLAHKSLLKSAERSVANDIIDKIMLIQIGDSDNKPSDNLIQQYSNMLSGVKGSIQLTVPYYVNASYVEPETTVFGQEKFLEIDADILNTLGVSLTLLRGEGSGGYSEGIINFTGLCRTIENIREPVADIVYGLYQNELERNGFSRDLAPKPHFKEVVIDKDAKMEMLMNLFQNAGLPYQVLYEGCDMDFDYVKLVREEENSQNMEDTFKLHAQPFQGGFSQEDPNGEGDITDEKQNNKNGNHDKGGRPSKSLTQRTTDKNRSNNNQPRANAKKKTNN